MIQSIATAILPETGRGTIRRMVEGQVRRYETSRNNRVPLHHFVVPLPVPGRN
jgi:competence protein ComGC